jgi:hypothetical protein
MKYNELINILNELGSHIQTYKDENIIDPNIIMKFLKNIFKEIPDFIKYHCIIHFNYIIKCANYINKRIEIDTNIILLDNIIIKLKEKQIIKTDGLDIVYNDILKCLL